MPWNSRQAAKCKSIMATHTEYKSIGSETPICAVTNPAGAELSWGVTVYNTLYPNEPSLRLRQPAPIDLATHRMTAGHPIASKAPHLRLALHEARQGDHHCAKRMQLQVAESI